jgi:hypothetical protein
MNPGIFDPTSKVIEWLRLGSLGYHKFLLPKFCETVHWRNVIIRGTGSNLVDMHARCVAQCQVNIFEEVDPACASRTGKTL